MTTVPKAGDPAPANNAHETRVSDSWSGNYGRPASGGAPVAGKQEGNAPTTDAPPGVIPGMSAYVPPAPASVTVANTQAGPDMGHGATIVVPSSGDRPSGGSGNLGTVGDSGNQGAGPGGMPNP